ncbi:MAG: hypothetical protein JXQ87_08290 [Bacteroidia bacterium]
MKNLFVLLFVFSLLFTACDDIFDPNDCENCRRVACTEEFKMIAISLVHKDGDAFEVDDYKITYTETGNEVDLNSSNNDELIAPNTYVIATDAMMDALDCEGTSITFAYNLKDGTNGKESFLVGKDCCHIQWKDTKETVITIE